MIDCFFYCSCEIPSIWIGAEIVCTLRKLNNFILNTSLGKHIKIIFNVIYLALVFQCVGRKISLEQKMNYTDHFDLKVDQSILVYQLLFFFDLSSSDFQQMKLFDGRNHLITFLLTNVSFFLLFFH